MLDVEHKQKNYFKMYEFKADNFPIEKIIYDMQEIKKILEKETERR